MTWDDLAQALATVGAPVIEPGATFVALPAIQLVPVRWELQAGNRFAYQVVDVVVCTHLTPYGPKYTELEVLTEKVLHALAGTQFQLDTVIEHTADPESEPAFQAMTVNVRYQGASLCP